MAELAARKAGVELAPVEVVAELRAQQVPVLRAIGQIIDRDHVVDADCVQAVDEVAADHAGGSGDNNLHGNNSS
jgi:hypothetical protein